MVLGSAKFGEAALFLSIVGSANFVFISFVPVILYFTHVEYIGSLADVPWLYLCGVAALQFGTETRHMKQCRYCNDYATHEYHFASVVVSHPLLCSLLLL